MSDYNIIGSCLCGEVSFKITGHLSLFQYCHCTRCQKATGSAFAANLFVNEDQFEWLSGEDKLIEYKLPDTKYFSTCFCQQCGSKLPWQPTGTTRRVIPAGSLDQDPDIMPAQHIHMASNAPWHIHNDRLPTFDEMPPRKPR